MRAPRLLLRLTGKAIALMALLVVFAAGTANAQDRCYVDTGGDNAQSGLTPATAKEDIQACVNEARIGDGDLISIEAGTYNEQVTFPSGKGVNLEARATGTFTRVIVSDGFVISDNVTVRPNSEGFADGVFRLEPDGADRTLDLVDGSLAITDPNGPNGDGRVRIASGEVRLDDDTSVSGDLTYLSAPILAYRDSNASNTNVTAGGEFPATFNGTAARLTVDLGGNNTLSFGSVVFDGGANLVVQAGSELQGTVIVEGDINISGGGDAGSLDVNDGRVEILSNLTVEDVDIADNDAITFDFNGNMLTVTGSFTRRGGSLAGNTAATLAFRGDADDETFGPGPNFSIQRLSIDKNGQTLTITEDVNVTASGSLALDIATGTTVRFSGDDNVPEQINVTSNGIVDVDGMVTGLSTIVFRAAGADIRGDGQYGDILVTTATGGNVTVGATTQEDVVFAGTLTLNAGGITVGGDDDLSPTGANAAVVINTADPNTVITGSFNDDNVDYNLTYTGAIAGASRIVGTEWETNDIRNLLVNATSGTINASAAAAGTISGTVTISGGANAPTVVFPTGAVTIAGALTVGDNATLGGATTLTLQSGSTVQGTIAAAVTTILANGVTLTGSNNNDHEAVTGPITVATNATATISNIQIINGTLTTNTGSSLTLTLAREQDITGNLVANGNSLTLGSLVDVAGNVTLDNVALNFQGNNLEVAGNFSGTSDVTYAGTGRLMLDTANKTFGTSGVSIPNVTVADVTATQSSAVVIGNSLIETGAGLIDQNGFALTIGGTVTTNGGTFIDNTGAAAALRFNTTTLRMSGDAQIDTGFTIAEGGMLTLASSTAAQRTLTVDDGNIVVDGDLALGGQIVNFIEATSDLVSAGGSVTGSGAVVIPGGNIEPSGNTFSVSNLTTTAATVDVGASTNGTLRLTGTLRLESDLNETDTNDNVAFANGATIVRAGGVLQDTPTFEGNVDVIYSVASTTGREIAADGDNIDNITVNAPVTVDQDLTVEESLIVASTLTQATTNDEVTLARDATLVLRDGFNIANAEIVTERFNLTVDTTGPTNLNDDVLDFVDEDEVVTLTVSMNGGAGVGILTVNDPTTVNHIVLDSGELELDANLTILGNLTFDGGTIDNDGTRRSLIFAGGSDAVIELDGDYVVDNIDFTLNKTGNAVLNLTGNAGDELDFLTGSRPTVPELLYLNGGILQTDMNAAVFLYQDANTQGFVRNVDAATDEESHISGNVRKRLYQGDPFGANPVTGGSRSARFEFPTGPAATAEAPDYRPYVLTFREQIVTTTDITVNHQNRNPEGDLGLPIQSGDVLIGNYPNYFWLVTASTSLGQAQSFDVELTGTDIGIPFTDEDDLRIIRRFDGDATTNEWHVQGAAGSYENFVSVDADGDTTAVVRVLNSTGGLVPQGARFTLGLPTRPPLFTSADPGTLTVDEGQGITFDFDADPQDLGETLRFSLADDAPAFVSIDAQTGILTAEPGVEDAGTYTFNVIATDFRTDSEGNLVAVSTTTQSVTIVVKDVLTITPAQEDVAISDGDTLTVDFDVDNPNPNDPVVWGLGEEVENASIDASTGVFTFTPDFDQVGQAFDFVVFARNASDSVAVQFTVTVEADLVYGDADVDGDVDGDDVLRVLDHAAGQITLAEGSKAFEQADVTDNGQVTALDAAHILQFNARLRDCFLADPDCNATSKTGAVAFGTPAWGDVSIDAQSNVITLPITLSGDVNNVYAVEFSANVDVELVTFKQVAGMLPNDWMMTSSFDKESGKLTIAMAGATPLSDAGIIANATFQQLDRDSKPVFRAEGFVNENASVEFGEIKAEQLPTEFALGDNYPNPFNPSTAITYALPQKAQVTLEIYDVAGRLVQTLVNQEKEAGRYTIQWDGQNAAGSQVASGLYVYRIKAGSFVEAKTMMLVK